MTKRQLRQRLKRLERHAQRLRKMGEDIWGRNEASAEVDKAIHLDAHVVQLLDRLNNAQRKDYPDIDQALTALENTV